MFHRDILIIDIEATGVDLQRHELIELGAVLLDKKTLKEKKSFESFVKPQHWGKRDPEAMAVNNITWQELKAAPTITTVLRKFKKTFGTNVMVGNYGTILDTAMLRKSFREAHIIYPYDYHVFDIWPLCFLYMAKRKKLTNKQKFSGFSLEDIATDLRIKVPENRHSALADCRLEAEVLRKLVKRIKV